MADDERKRLEDEKKRKQAETDRKRAEVRARLEEASKAKKAKKGFMTPDRKKKLRLLLRKKAAEELKKEQERKAAERRRIIEERCGKPKNVDDANEETVKRVLREYHNRITSLEDQKFDLEYVVKKKDYEVLKRKWYKNTGDASKITCILTLSIMTFDVVAIFNYILMQCSCPVALSSSMSLVFI